MRRYCPCGCWRHPYQRIRDYVIAVITRISRARTIDSTEIYGLASRLAAKHSWGPGSTLNAVLRHAERLIFVRGGEWFYAPEPWEMEPELAWDEGRQCVPLSRRHCATCDRWPRRDRLVCVGCMKLFFLEQRLIRERYQITKLVTNLRRAAREHEDRAVA